MKGFALRLIFLCLIICTQGIYAYAPACQSYTFTNDANNITIHRVRYLDDQQKPTVIQLTPGDSAATRGRPTHFTINAYANLDPKNVIHCDVYVGVENRPDQVAVDPSKEQRSNITARCPVAYLNSKTCEITFMDAGE